MVIFFFLRFASVPAANPLAATTKVPASIERRVPLALALAIDRASLSRSEPFMSHLALIGHVSSEMTALHIMPHFGNVVPLIRPVSPC